jgi:hypothetical protein
MHKVNVTTNLVHQYYVVCLWGDCCKYLLSFLWWHYQSQYYFCAYLLTKYDFFTYTFWGTVTYCGLDVQLVIVCSNMLCLNLRVPVENQQNLTCDSVIQLKSWFCCTAQNEAVCVIASQNEAVSVVWLTEYAVLSCRSQKEDFSVVHVTEWSWFWCMSRRVKRLKCQELLVQQHSATCQKT